MVSTSAKTKYNKVSLTYCADGQSTLIIRIPLLLFIAAILTLLVAELLSWLAVPMLPSTISQLGLVILLASFSVFIGAGLIALVKIIVRALADYFSSAQRVHRRLLFVQARQDQIKRLYYFRTVQLKYFNALKRTRLLKANNRKHIHSLSNAIHQQLLTIKTDIPAETLKQLQQQNARCRRQQNIEALLLLQQNISSLTNKQ